MDLEQLLTERLEREGWKRQFIANGPRLNEAVQVYEDAGFEVHLEPLPVTPLPIESGPLKTSIKGECRKCFNGFEGSYRIIFTRPCKKMDSPHQNNLF
ncbi:MAG: hypothetical protein C4582_02300 [Desulfobacteraceae bacterium]|nr:MAG: hypothetical protein C4582_02300 [Desulfobacteraceae bacterium]